MTDPVVIPIQRPAGAREVFLRLPIYQQITMRSRELHAWLQKPGWEPSAHAKIEALRLDMTRWAVELEDAAYDVTQIMAENTRLRRQRFSLTRWWRKRQRETV